MQKAGYEKNTSIYHGFRDKNFHFYFFFLCLKLRGKEKGGFTKWKNYSATIPYVSFVHCFPNIFAFTGSGVFNTSAVSGIINNSDKPNRNGNGISIGKSR